MRLRAGRGVAGVAQRARQVELGAVDGEDAVAEPGGPGLVGAAQDLGVELLEDGLVNLEPGLAHGGVGDRLRLRQGHLEGAALGPQLGQRRDVALAAGANTRRNTNSITSRVLSTRPRFCQRRSCAAAIPPSEPIRPCHRATKSASGAVGGAGAGLLRGRGRGPCSRISRQCFASGYR